MSASRDGIDVDRTHAQAHGAGEVRTVEKPKDRQNLSDGAAGSGI